MMRSHAIANGVFVAAANRVGSEGTSTIEFWGASFVADPNGNVLAEGRPRQGRTLLVPSATSTALRRRDVTGRSSATAGSTPTATCQRYSGRTVDCTPFHDRDDPPCRPDTPAALGYRLPAEWEPHAATWLAWPHKPRDLARQVRADPGRLGGVRARRWPSSSR